MKFDIITLFPEIFNALEYGITGRALKNKLASLTFWNPRDFADEDTEEQNTHTTDRFSRKIANKEGLSREDEIQGKTKRATGVYDHIHEDCERSFNTVDRFSRKAVVDDRPFGGGPGMVMKYQPLKKAIQAARQGNKGPVIYLSPQGKRLDHEAILELKQHENLTLLCGRYEGIDERLIQDEVDLEYSVGDLVVSGGEIPAMLMIDSIIRLLPGALGHKDSAAEDSFHNGLLDHPHYTRPEQIDNKTVPDVLRSGDHQAIKRWRLKQSLGITWQKRPDLLKRQVLTELEQKLLAEFIEEAKRR